MNDQQRWNDATIDGLSFLNRLRLLWALLRDDRVSPWLRRLGPVGVLIYVLSPIDIIPDFLLGPGQLDDLGVITVLVLVLSRLMVRFAPPGVVAEHLATMGRRPTDRTAREEAGPVFDTTFRERRDH